MKRDTNRRGFLKSAGVLVAGVGLTGLGRSRLLAAELAGGAPNAERRMGWRLGCGTWSFRHLTFFEAIDKTASVGLHHLEAVAGQQLSKERPDVKFSGELPADARRIVKQKLADSSVKLVNVFFALPKDAGQCRRTFEFAKEMGVETIVSEPDEDNMEMLDTLCHEYDINVAIHNHPKPSHYWNPDTVLKVCRGRSHRIGACADTGHWPRCGLDTLECLKKLEGRIISFHFKDLDSLRPDSREVPWGSGVCDLRGWLAEVHRQKIKAVFVIECENPWENSQTKIAQSIHLFDKIAADLAAKG
jgi:sugar phosphate isomerase/epimerase